MFLLVKSLLLFLIINTIMFIHTCDNDVQYMCRVQYVQCIVSTHADTHTFMYSTGNTVDVLHW